MALIVQLNRLPTPFGTEFPGLVDDHLQLIQEYMEITGLEDFNGVNYGSTTPDAGNRDKPWFRLTTGGVFIGWYVWDGAAWSLGMARAREVTEAQLAAITSPQGGWQVWHTGSAVMKVYDSTAATWKPAVPDVTLSTYDRNYFFDAHQLLATTTASSGGWLPVDLTTYISDAGITGTPKAAIIRLETSLGIGIGGPMTIWGIIKANGGNGVSTSSTDVLTAYAQGSRDDSATSCSAQICGPVKMTTNTIYYFANYANAVATSNVWLVGFIY